MPSGGRPNFSRAPCSIFPSDFGQFIFQKWRKNVFFVFLAEKPKNAGGGPPKFSMSTQFQFSPRFSVTSFWKYHKTLLFVKFLHKKRKNAGPMGPQTCHGGHVPPGCATALASCPSIVSKADRLNHQNWSLEVFDLGKGFYGSLWFPLVACTKWPWRDW